MERKNAARYGRECKLNSAGLTVDQARTLARVRSAFRLVNDTIRVAYTGRILNYPIALATFRYLPYNR